VGELREPARGISDRDENVPAIGEGRHLSGRVGDGGQPALGIVGVGRGIVIAVGHGRLQTLCVELLLRAVFMGSREGAIDILRQRRDVARRADIDRRAARRGRRRLEPRRAGQERDAVQEEGLVGGIEVRAATGEAAGHDLLIPDQDRAPQAGEAAVRLQLQYVGPLIVARNDRGRGGRGVGGVGARRTLEEGVKPVPSR